MKVELNKTTREKFFTKFDSNRITAGAHILKENGVLEIDLNDETMKAKEKQNTEISTKNLEKKENKKNDKKEIPSGKDFLPGSNKISST